MTSPTSETIRKTAIVTGAARGIGLATAKRFLAEGWNVMLFDILGDLVAEETAKLEPADRVLAVEGDISVPDQVEAGIKATVEKFGAVHALVNNAGIAEFGPILDMTLELWNRVMEVNLTGTFLFSQAIVPHMRDAGGGAIVNIASISGLRASTLRVAYGTSKAGVIHLTKQQAAEFAQYGIRANAVAPGPVDTAMAKKVHTPEIRADYHDHMPLNRYGLEEELAEAIYFLCSEKSSYITGQLLAVDGGFDSTGIGLPTLRAERNN